MTKLEEAIKTLSIRTRGNILQIAIPTSGCKLGHCIFCNYGKSELLPLDKCKGLIIEVLKHFSDKTTLILDGMGSILDINEIPQEYLFCICKEINSFENIQTIIFETHYLTINEDILLKLREIFPNKNLEIELGLETCNKENQRNIRKTIDLTLLQEKIKLVHKYNFNIEANIFFGIPFLSKNERLVDCLETIKWAIINNIDDIVIFPCNLRTNTNLYELYKKGQYELVSHFEILRLCTELDEDSLKKITFSWYGDWIQKDKNGELINYPPLVSLNSSHNNEKLENTWKKFYEDFHKAETKTEVVNKYINILKI